jgi:ABC-2 type transport system permease protein
MSESTSGVIHDIGYRRYEGVRLGRGHILRSMYAHSMRTAFGFGRGVKAKLFPWAVAGVVAAVAVVLTAINSRSPEPVSTYPQFVDSMSVPAILFLAAAAPEMVSRDLRSRVLTLYFARPVRRPDYVYAKLAALISAVFLVLAGPQLIIFAGGAFAADSVSEFRRHVTDLLGGWLYTGIFAVITASLALFIASLTGRRMFAAAGVVGVFVVTIPMAAVVWELGGDGAVRELSGLVTPTWLVMGIGDWLLGHEGVAEIDKLGPVYGAAGVLMVAACVAILLVRYRRVEQ